MVSGTRAPQGTRLNPRFTREVTPGLTVTQAVADADNLTGDWTILAYPGVYNEGDLTPNGGADITIRGMGHERVEIAPAVAPAAGVIVSGNTLSLENIVIRAPDATMPPIRVTGGTLELESCDIYGVGVGDAIQMVDGTINAYRTTIHMGDIDLSTAACILNMYYCRIVTDPIDTAGAFVHQVTLVECDLNSQNINSAATGATIINVTGCPNVGALAHAGTGAVTIRDSEVASINLTAAGTVVAYGGYIGAVTRAVGSVVWWLDGNTLKVIPSGTTTDTMIGWALAAAAAGDVILVHPGTYDEPVVCVAGVDIKGIGPPGSVIIQQADAGIITWANNVELQNFTIRLGAPSAARQLVYDGAAACTATLRDIIFEITTPGAFNHTLMRLYGAGNYTVEGCFASIGACGATFYTIEHDQNAGVIHLFNNDFTAATGYHIRSGVAGTITGGQNRWAGACAMFSVVNGTITLDKDAVVCTGSASGDVTGGTVVCRTGENSYEVYEGMVIQHAVATGRYIYVHPGTYTLTASLDITVSDLTIQGAGRQTIIYTVTANLDTIYVHGGAGTELTNVILRDFLVRSDHTNDIGILYDYVDYSKIINVWSEHNGEHGILLSSCDHCEIEGVYSYSNTFYGISINGSTWVEIINGICNSNTLSGMSVGSSSWIKLVGAVCNSNTQNGIYLIDSADCQLISPTCNSNDSGGTTYSGIYLLVVPRTTIESAACDANGLHGIFILRSSNCSVIGGQCNNQNTGDGVHIAGTAANNADYNIVTGVVATGNGSDGVEISEVGAGQANKNIITSCQLLGNGGVPLNDGGTNTELGHNIVV